ncbi:hypothetical protein LIER_15918 [Lithospermum erythrorhizon]|uniref:Uncharacterized protein n=1 Tax=Lithospermum erythrorhizon TaxID=34254 RepID=A0AAV3Q7V0_LITER
MVSGQPCPPPVSASGVAGISSSGLLGFPYTLPSGITVTEEMISKGGSLTASLLLLNCLLKGDMEGIMGHPTPSSVHDAFSHFYLKSHLSYSFRSMACARGLFLRWSECEESRAASEVDKISLEKRLSEVIRKRDEARAQADHFKAQAFDFNNKHADIQSVCAGLVKSKSNLSSKQERELIVFNSSLEEAAVHIKEFQSQNRDTRKLLAGSLEELRWRPLPELLWQTLRRVKIKRTFLWMTPSPS